MSEKPYDKKTEEKLYSLYQKVISNYYKENNSLNIKLKDLKATLNLNKKLLHEYLYTSDTNKDEINNSIKKSEILWNKIESLTENKRDTQIDIYKLQVIIKNASNKINQELNDIIAKNNLLKNEISQKDKLIKKLKQDLEKSRKSALFHEARTEIYVCEPSKKNIEKNCELINARYILGKMASKHSKLRSEAIKLRNERDDLKTELKEVIENVPEKYLIPDFLESLGYNFSIDIEKEEDEIKSESEEEDNSDSSEEEVPGEGKKYQKRKEKELERLKNKYNELKEVYDNFQKKINEYKIIYKKYKNN